MLSTAGGGGVSAQYASPGRHHGSPCWPSCKQRNRMTCFEDSQLLDCRLGAVRLFTSHGRQLPRLNVAARASSAAVQLCPSRAPRTTKTHAQLQRCPPPDLQAAALDSS